MKSIELFAGAGGLGIGLHEAGFHPVSVVEWDDYCCDTIRENQARGNEIVADWKVAHGDVREINFAKYENKVQLVSGGPPCQPFSLGGKHQAYNDTRDMFPQAIRAVREIRPRAFIFENVKGLTRPAFRNYFEYIRLQMEHPEIVRRKSEDWATHHARLEQHHTSGSTEGLNYRVVAQVVNAANYGVPQRRERVFFVGFREDLGISWHFPKATHSLDALTRDQLTGDYWDRHSVSKKNRPSQNLQSGLLVPESDLLPWRTVRDALQGMPDPERNPRSSVKLLNHLFQPGARSYPGHTGSPLDEPAKTLKAGVHGVPGGENMLLKPDGSVRYFTVRESARLQTFPDDFLFHGSWGQTMRQLGNAVPVRLARLVGEGRGVPPGKGGMTDGPYNPLDKFNLAKSIENEILSQEPIPLGDVSEVVGAGVYALYYVGPFAPYAPIAAANAKGTFGQPIYAGKAIPRGGRKGGFEKDAAKGDALRKRLRNHAASIRGTNLEVDHFFVRYLVVDDVWIPLGENSLIHTFRPLWNIALDGFGNNATGKNRGKQVRSAWDTLHPGRKRALKLPDNGIGIPFFEKRVADHIAGRELDPLPKVLSDQEEDEEFDEIESADNV